VRVERAGKTAGKHALGVEAGQRLPKPGGGIAPSHAGDDQLAAAHHIRPAVAERGLLPDREADQKSDGHGLGFSLHLIPANQSFQIRYSNTVAFPRRRQSSAISRQRPSASNEFTSMPVTPWLFGDSMPNALQ